ncbi:hypothetical protein V6N13_064153 [Hibiscus sabdariffa]|uniref:Uncharacterized protein n=2 Tax=Hibiscus sabdariffa TaxID=183260 RepID=A0ABR2R2E5_9ROSI
MGPAIEKSVAHEAAGVKPSTLGAKEIPLIKNPFLQIKIAPKIPNEQKDDDANDGHKRISEEPKREGLDAKQIASADELEKGKLPPKEILSLQIFKNYRTGNPASVLYMKNVAKDVVPEDFYFIFAKSGLNVKLMQEGRMRGQGEAFVTFPSVELAHHALSKAEPDLLPTCCYRAYGKPSSFLSSNVIEAVASPSQFFSVHGKLGTSMLTIDASRTYV